MKDPFYLVCGYGLTGSAVVADLAQRGVQSVVIEIDQSRVDALELDNHPFDIPILCADASDPDVLQDAGVDHGNCIGTLCLTDDDHVNLYIALASKLLSPERLVLSRVATREYAGNLLSFGTDHVVDPFEIFAEYLTNAVVYPYRQLVYNWLISPKHRALRTLMRPDKGRWIICGYGRLGRAIQKRFESKGLQTVIIEPEPELRNIHEDYRVVKGLGTEAPTLLEAGIHKAVGIVAGTADDANNLSIVLTARDLKSSLKLVARQNRNSNAPVFAAAKVDMIMDPNMIIAQRIMALLKSPLLVRFLDEIQTRDEIWCEQLIRRFDALVQDNPLESWSMTVTKEDMTAVYEVLRLGDEVELGKMLVHPQNAEHRLRAMPLMILRNDQVHLLPDDQFLLRIEDKILFCGLRKMRSQMQWTAYNRNVLRYVLSGDAEESGLLWQRLFRKKT